MDPEEARRLTEELSRLGDNTERMMRGLANAGERVKRDGVDAIRALNEEWTKGIEDGARELVDASAKGGERMAENIKNPISKAFKSLKEEFDDMTKTQRRELGRLGRSVDSSIGRGQDRAGGMISGLQRLSSGVFSGLPFGGLFGLMMFGRMREQQYASMVQSATQTLQGAGSLSRAQIRELGKDLRGLEQQIPGITGHFQAANASMAALGYTASDALQPIERDIAMVEDNVRNLTMAMDAHFELSKGEAMTLGATIAQNTNAPLRESVELIAEIGTRVQDTGISFKAMTGAVIQTTSALRMQTNELSEAASIADQIQIAQAGFTGQGMGRQRAGAIAASGVQGIAGAIANLPIGLKAVMGEEMGGGRGLGAVRQFERGFRQGPGSGQFFQQSMSEILRMSSDIAGGDPDKQYHVLKELFGMNVEQAQTMMAIQDATRDGTTVEKATAENAEALNKAFKDEALKADLFKRLMNMLIDLVATVGNALLDLIATGLESLISIGRWMMTYLSQGGTSPEQDRAVRNHLLMLGNRSDRALEVLDRERKEGGSIAKVFGKAIAGRTEGERRTGSAMSRALNERPPTDEIETMGDKMGLGWTDWINPLSYMVMIRNWPGTGETVVLDARVPAGASSE